MKLRVIPSLFKFLIAAGLLVVAAMMVALLLPDPGIPGTGIVFSVPEGEGASELAHRLESQSIIPSAFVFRAVAVLSGRSGSLKSGTYRFAHGMNTLAVLNTIAQGREYAIRVTIPEGSTLRGTAAILESAGIVESKDFLEAANDPEVLSSLGLPWPTAEGYLFPDTYFLTPGSPSRLVLQRMIDNFNKRAQESGYNDLDNPAVRDKLILASIIEREYRIPDEAPRMASVFKNRLTAGMRLQSCATVVYVLTEELGRPHPDFVSYQDLAIQSRYNSYRNAGLPPGPICSPGATALHAAAFPASTPYLYFRIIDPATGRHHFSRTLDEHVDARIIPVKKRGS